MSYYAGIEGGGTHCTLVIVDQQGKPILEMNGGPLNIFQVGFENSAERILKLLNEACTNLPSKPLSLGLCLSGAVEDKTKIEFLDVLKALDSKKGILPPNMFLSSDAEGSLATIFGDDEGMILISGTGSAAMFRSHDGVIYNAGGWGHLMGGDQGSAFWIAQTAIMRVYNCMEHMIDLPPSMSTEFVWKLIQKWFKIDNIMEILPHFYTTDLMKTHVAAFTKHLAEETFKRRDNFAISIFEEAGWWLGRHIVAVLTQYAKAEDAWRREPWTHEKCNSIPHELHVFSAGEVWKSISLLKYGISRAIRECKSKSDVIHNLESIVFYESQVPVAFGASYLGQKHLDEGRRMNYCAKGKRLQICQLKV